MTEPALFEVSDLTIDAGRAHSCLLHPTDSDETALSLVVDDRSVIDPARIRIRPVNLARGGAIDFYQTRQVGNPIPLGTDLSPGGASQTASTLSAGSFEFAVALSSSVGAELMPDFAARFITPNLPSGTNANVYVVSNGNDLILILHLSDGSTQQVDPTPMVRLNLTHVGTDGQAVDLFIGTSSIFSGVGFAQSPAPTTQLPVGVYTLSVTLSGNGPENAFTSIEDSGLSEGRWNAFVYRQAPPAGNNPGLALAAFPEDITGAFGNTRLRMVHAAHTIAAVEVCLVNESLVQRLTQAAISLGAWTGANSAEDSSDDYIGLPSGTYQLGFDIRMNGESSVACSAADLVFQLPPLPSESVSNVFLMNDITGPLLIIQNTTGALSAAIRPIT